MDVLRSFESRKPVIGMVHLHPLPGSPRWRGSLEEVFEAALRDASVLAEEGMDGILVENFGDVPFHPREVPPATVAAMTAVLLRLREKVGSRHPGTGLPGTGLSGTSVPGTGLLWGVNVLRNDARAALAVAAAVQASFIRVNVHCGVTATDQGLLEGRAHETMRLRASLAPQVAVFADAQVKHGRPLGPPGLSAAVADLCERGLADAVLVTGDRTGEAPSLEEVAEACRAAGSVPVLVASGATAGNVKRLLEPCRGVIVGTSLKEGGRTEAPVDRRRVRAFLERVREGT